MMKDYFDLKHHRVLWAFIGMPFHNYTSAFHWTYCSTLSIDLISVLKKLSTTGVEVVYRSAKFYARKNSIV